MLTDDTSEMPENVPSQRSDCKLSWMLGLLTFPVEVFGEEIRRSVPPEDDGGFLLTSHWLYWKIHADAVSEAISFDSGENVGFTGRFMLTLFPR
ncbi:unnamed protein product [Protopolystoma xenopodis]|uniref:Uncharacterized protein n=1 Tax=Protopolystoma xenopodis TaxID=117903 RepID=A0A3S5AX75_9PLAT|nr:unnamed protein product [Protopolystoma xenopodis]